MTISVGSYHDLHAGMNTQPIDRNPRVPCVECGDKQDWKTWQDQYDEITPETRLRCPGCWGHLIEQARIERKAARNHSLLEWLHE